MTQVAPFIGSHITLISKSDIRYEGTLYTIDTQESTLALKEVKSFGTEGRKYPEPEISPSEEIFDFIVFKGSDIKDLQVKSDQGAGSNGEPATTAAPRQSAPAPARAPVQQPQPPQAKLPGDILPPKAAATVQVTKPKGGNRSQSKASVSSNPNKPAWTGKNAANQLGIPVQERTNNGHHHRGERRNYASANTSQRQRQHQHHPQAQAEVKIPEYDFDFNKMFAKFKKEEFFEKETIEVVKYEKDDFFDAMSSDTNAPKERPDYRQQRRTDAETFGMNAANAQRSFHRQHGGGRGGRGGYRGGNGRGRGGRGGGGYNNRDRRDNNGNSSSYKGNRDRQQRREYT